MRKTEENEVNARTHRHDGCRCAAGDCLLSDDASATLAMALDNQDGLKKSYNLRYASGEGSIAAGYFHSIGLYRDGTVVATGENICGECDVSGWTGIGCGLTLE